ncbi:LIC_10190 family membrane protein [Roseomonas sp. HF4]|uniref:LIC_10190 family membrane protein n=1 Tax=Roseomonas sp. HF4 TaxID=2562313 RepID=UPI0010C1310A|nr:hypothetical protein [Roseomonas sp. HF4]
MLLSGALVILAAAICLGYGLLCVRMAERVRPGLSRAVTVGDVGLLGYVALGLLATVLNLFVPLSGPVAAVCCLVGLGLLVLGRHHLTQQAKNFGWSAFATVLALVALCLYLGTLIPGSTASHYDTGLYHLQAIRQIIEYPLILGAANIHMRFGYNSQLFQTSAILTGGVSSLAGAITTNALLIAFVALAVLTRAAHWKDALFARPAIFGILFVVLAVFTPILSLRSWAGTPNTDIPSGMMVLYSFYLAILLSDVAVQDGRSDEVAGTAALLMAVLALAVTLKLSAAPVVLLAALVMLKWRRGQIALRDVALSGAGALAIGLPWLARGIATSGCIAYPQPSSCLPVPWRVAHAVAQSDLDWMRAWARKPETSPEIVLADWSWFPGWLASLHQEPAWPVFVILAGAAAACILARLLLRGLVTAGEGPTPQRAVDLVILLGVAFVGVGFWFLSAPLVRYGQTWLVLPLLLLIAHFAPIGIRHAGNQITEWRALEMLQGRSFSRAVALGLALLVFASLVRKPANLLVATDIVQHQQVEVRSQGVHAGIPILVPARGNQCWDAPRICTPHLKEGLIFTPFLWTWMIRDPS